MPLSLSISLSGKQNLNENTLLGKSINNSRNHQIPLEIKKMKIKLMNDYLIPVYQKQWIKVFNNLFFLPNIKRKMDTYRSFVKEEDWSIYFDLVNLLELVVEKEKLFINNQQNNNNLNKNIFSQEAVSLMVRLTTIRLLPEYEVYNSIYGKPLKEEKETYDLKIINYIQYLLKKENMNFDRMKLILDQTYPIKV